MIHILQNLSKHHLLFRKPFRMKYYVYDTFQQINDFTFSVFLGKLTPLDIVSELSGLFFGKFLLFSVKDIYLYLSSFILSFSRNINS